MVTKSRFDVVSVSGGPAGSPTTISPVDADALIVLASNGGTGNWFQLAAGFSIGDVVEWRQMDNLSGLALKDAASNIVLSTNNQGNAARARMVQSGTSDDWLVT
jgi:hypothetical protein